MKPGDRVRVIGRQHPWKGATGVIARPYRHHGSRLDWLLRLDPPYGYPAYGRESCASSRDIEPEDVQAQLALPLVPP